MLDSSNVMGSENVNDFPGALLWQVSKLWQQRVNDAVSGLGLSNTNAFMLLNALNLSIEHKPTTQIALSRLANIDLMTTSLALRALETKGLITRETSKTDKRAREIVLTSKGKAIARKASQRIAATHDEFFDAISKSDDMPSFITALKELRRINTMPKNPEG